MEAMALVLPWVTWVPSGPSRILFCSPQIPVQEAARKHALPVAVLEEWKDRFLSGANNALRSRPRNAEQLKDEIDPCKNTLQFGPHRASSSSGDMAWTGVYERNLASAFDHRPCL